jgi:hypothetical protein
LTNQEIERMSILLRESEELIRKLLLNDRVGVKELYKAQELRERIEAFRKEVPL